MQVADPQLGVFLSMADLLEGIDTRIGSARLPDLAAGVALTASKDGMNQAPHPQDHTPRVLLLPIVLKHFEPFVRYGSL